MVNLKYSTAKKIYDLTKNVSKRKDDTAIRYNKAIYLSGYKVFVTDGHTATMIEFKEKLSKEIIGIDPIVLKSFVMKKDKKAFFTDIHTDKDYLRTTLLSMVEKSITDLKEGIALVFTRDEIMDSVTRLLSIRVNPLKANHYMLPMINMVLKPGNLKEVAIIGRETSTAYTGNKEDYGSEIVDCKTIVNNLEKRKVLTINGTFLTGFLNECLGRRIAVKIGPNNADPCLWIDDPGDDMTEDEITAHYCLIMPVRK